MQQWPKQAREACPEGKQISEASEPVFTRPLLQSHFDRMLGRKGYGHEDLEIIWEVGI